MKNIRVSHKTGTEILQSDEEDDELDHIHDDDDDDTEDDQDDDEDDEDDDDDVESSDWVDIPDPTRSRDLDPDESASRSRSRHPLTASARHYAYPRSSAQRSQSARKPPAYPEVVEPPSVPPPGGRRGGSNAKERLHRSKSAAPSGMSGEEDDFPYPYVHPFGPGAEWGRGMGGGGMYPNGARGWGDPSVESYLDPGQTPNPFSPGFGGGGGGNADYFGRRGNRMSMPIRTGNELVNPAFFGYPPGFPPYYPQFPHTSPSPHNNSKKSTPPPSDDSKAVTDPRIDMIQSLLIDAKKREDQRLQQDLARRINEEQRHKEKQIKEEDDKIKRLELIILKHNADQLEREKKAEALRKAEEIAKKEAELKALEQKRIADEKDKEVKAAADLAKYEAQQEAAKKADEAKEKWDKEMEELKKKAAETEAQKKKFEEEAKKLRPGDDLLKPPIRFKDAVGRKFSFPWHICKTWKGMESLIHQAFLHVEPIGKQVADGHYDLIGPGGEIILPQVWETMVRPDMSISMHMWPMPEKESKKSSKHHHHADAQAALQADLTQLLGMGGGGGKGEKKKGKKRDKGQHPPPMPPPPGLNAILGGAVPPPPPPPPPSGALAPGVVEKAARKGGGSVKGGKKTSKSAFSLFGATKGSGSKSRKKQG